jgi:hypothetical protein
MTTTVATGDRVWYPDCDTEHPAIVVRVSDDRQRALVICGTATFWKDKPLVCIDPSPNGVARLIKKTYFYQDRVHDCAVTDLRHHNPKARCPQAKWEAILLLAEAGARARLNQERFERWWPTRTVDAPVAPVTPEGASDG